MLGEDVAVAVSTYDEGVQRVPIRRIVRRSRRRGEHLLVCLAGVQSNMFARATDLAMAFRAEGVPVVLGGFHVSGVLAMFEKPTPELQRLMDAGVSLVQGEAEAPGVTERILADALSERLEPLYRCDFAPDITHAPHPAAETGLLAAFHGEHGHDGHQPVLPFQLLPSARSSTCRAGGCAAGILRPCCRASKRASTKACARTSSPTTTCRAAPRGRRSSTAWPPCANSGKPIRFMMQVDTQAWRVPRFMEKAAAAGCSIVFIGLESVNPANMEATGKEAE